MTNERFDFLVNEVVVKNGDGHKFLAKLVEDNEISKLEETKILIAAKLSILAQKIEEWSDNIE
jgi:hypothetical protein